MNRFSKPLAALAVAGTVALAAGCTSNPQHAGGPMGGSGHAHSSSQSQTHESGMMQMHDHMQKMNTMMQQMHQAQSPEEKQQLMQAHMQEMHKHMAMMRGMMQSHGAGGMGDMQQQCMQMMDQMMLREQMTRPANQGPDAAEPSAEYDEGYHDHDHDHDHEQDYGLE